MKIKILFLIILFLAGLPKAQAFESEMAPGEVLTEYLAKKASYDLYGSPSLASAIVGKWTTKPGAKIPVNEVIVRTVKAGEITYPKAGLLMGRNLGKIRKLTKELYYSDKIPTQELKIPQGTSMEYLMYRAEGNYLVRYLGSVWEMTPSIEIVKVDSKLETWLQVKGSDGKPLGWLDSRPEAIQVKKGRGD